MAYGSVNVPGIMKETATTNRDGLMSKEDKTTLDQAVLDIVDINTQLSSKAEAEPPQKFELPLAEGWTKYQQPYYQRNAFGEVTIWGAVKKDSAIEKSDVIATLPKGFWPPAPFEAPAMKFVDGAPTAVMVFVHGNGQISTSSTTSTGSAALSFIITYAGQ